MTLGERMKQLRKERGLTMLSISEAVGVTEATVQRYEADIIKTIKYETLKKLAEVLGTTVGDLIGSNENPKKSDGVNDILKWMEEKCKIQKKIVDNAQTEYDAESAKYHFDDELCILEDAKQNLEIAQAKLNTLVDVKIGTEKYLRKLRHNDE